MTAVREKQPLKVDQPENDQELDVIKRDLTHVVRLSWRIGITVAASRVGSLMANSQDCFTILEDECVITKDLADVLRAAVGSWKLFATDLEEINATVTSHFCRCFLDDFDAYLQAMREYQSQPNGPTKRARVELISSPSPNLHKR
ncbi:hypothetical protein [Thiorhodovibrio frisius]|uniref:hypothetical protein n=1 Tax=Thiorhodovibrio frisius TaxID=631362 RepID=UPI00117E96BE|nr:hypothetical protein [Thiorhodovibrio frisius]